MQIYVDDIIFGATNETLCKEFSSSMQKEFEMSMMGELNFFLGLQVKQMKHGTFLCQTKYYVELIKKFVKEKCKEASTPMATSTYLDLDEKGKSVDESRCCNLPFGRRVTRGSQVRLPRKKNARSRHQRLFEENVRKTGKGVVYEI